MQGRSAQRDKELLALWNNVAHLRWGGQPVHLCATAVRPLQAGRCDASHPLPATASLSASKIGWGSSWERGGGGGKWEEVECSVIGA